MVGAHPWVGLSWGGELGTMGGGLFGGGELGWSWDYEAKPLHPLPKGWEAAMGPALHSDLCPAVFGL